MRIIQFYSNAIPPEYTNSRSNFRLTLLVDTTYIGEYYGTDLSIPNYDGSHGPWPLTPRPTLEYKTSSITKTEWRKLFELTEQITSDKVKEEIKGDLSFLPVDVDTPHPLIPIHTHRDILRTGYASFSDTNTIDVTDAGTILMINTMLMVGILSTQQRVDDILKGVLQEN